MFSLPRLTPAFSVVEEVLLVRSVRDWVVALSLIVSKLPVPKSGGPSTTKCNQHSAFGEFDRTGSNHSISEHTERFRMSLLASHQLSISLTLWALTVAFTPMVILCRVFIRVPFYPAFLFCCLAFAARVLIGAEVRFVGDGRLTWQLLILRTPEQLHILR